MDAARLRLEDEHDRLIAQAWHTAAFTAEAKAGKLANLDVVLKRRHAAKPRPRQDDARQQRAAWLDFARIYKIPVKTVH